MEASKRLNINSSFHPEPAIDTGPIAVDMVNKSPGNSELAGDGPVRTGSAVKVSESAMRDIESKDENAQVGDKPVEFTTEHPTAAMDEPPKFDQKFSSMMDSSGLSPTPRKSERSKSAVNYNRLASGAKDPLSDLDEHLAPNSKKLQAEKRI